MLDVRAGVVGGLVGAVLGIGCGDDGAGPMDLPDAGRPDAGVPDAGSPPPTFVPDPPEIDWLEEGTPVEIPWLAAGSPVEIPWLEDGNPVEIPWLEEGAPPIAWTCPEGWRRTMLEDVPVCDPYPEAGGDLDCDRGEAHFPGEPACAPIGDPCPTAGAFPSTDDLTADRWFARAGASPGGDGSPGAPFATLADAFDAAEAGDWVVLAAGDYDVDRRWPTGVSLRGACVAQTRLTTTVRPAREAVVDVRGVRDDLRIENVEIGPAPLAGIVVDSGTVEVVIDGIEVHAVVTAAGAIVIRNGADANVTSAVVRDTLTSEAGDGGRGVMVTSGSTLTMSRAVIASNFGAGVVVSGSASSATLTDLVARDQQPDLLDQTRGYGISAEDGASLTVRRALLERNHDRGLIAFLEGSRFEAADLVVRDTNLARDSESGGLGVSVALGATGTLTRATIVRSRGAGIFAADEDSVLTASDVVVSDTRGVLERVSGPGFAAVVGGRIEVARGVAGGSAGYGVTVENGGAADLTDVLIRETRALPDGDLGMGAHVVVDSSLDASRLVLDDNRWSGVFLNESSTATLSDLVVRRTRPRVLDGDLGTGLITQERSSATITRALLEDNHTIGALAFEGTTQVLEDVRITRTQPRRLDGDVGRAIESPGGRVTVRRALMDENHTDAIVVAFPEGRMTLEDVVVRDMLPGEFSDVGRALLAVQDAELTVERLLVERAIAEGVIVADGAVADIDDIVVRDTQPVGPTDGFGSGLVLANGAVATVDRALLEGNRNVGLLVIDEGVDVTASDVIARDTDATGDGTLGIGVGVARDARLTLTRAEVSGNQDVGVVFLDESEGTLTDLLVRDTRSRPSDDAEGTGISFGRASVVTLDGALVSGNRNVGITVRDVDTVATITDVRVVGTMPPACGAACSISQTPGVGLSVVEGAVATVERFELVDGAACGLQLATDAELDLSEGLIQGNPRGICLQLPDYALSRLLDNVALDDNAAPIEFTTFAVPSPAEALSFALE